MDFYTRGQIAEKTGLSLDTLRYYERVGLVPQVDRTPAGRRRYTELDLMWFHLVRCLRDSGMPIAQIQTFTDLMRDGAATVDERLAVLRVHERRVEDQIARLGAHLQQIRGKIAGYTAGDAWSAPAGTKPAGVKPAGAKPAGMKPAGVKLAGSAPAQSKPVRVEGGGVRTG